MRQTTLVLIIIIFHSFSYGQEKVIFHSYSPTASSWKILVWNIKDPINTTWVLKEIVDKEGRVSELQFLKNGKLTPDILCYLANRITFSYSKNEITERYFYGYEEPFANEFDMPYKSIYHLENDYIRRVETFHKFDTINYTSEEIIEAKKYVPEYFNFWCNESTNTEIQYYYHSLAKMNGMYPVNKGYKFEYGNYYYYDREPVNTEILNGIEKIKNNR